MAEESRSRYGIPNLVEELGAGEPELIEEAEVHGGASGGWAKYQQCFIRFTMLELASVRR